jgi:hypothetical protein
MPYDFLGPSFHGQHQGNATLAQEDQPGKRMKRLMSCVRIL